MILKKKEKMREISFKKIVFFVIKWSFLPVLVIAIYGYFYLYPPDSYEGAENIKEKPIVKAWKKLSNNRKGKVLYARPPRMFILDLNTGVRKEVPNIVVAGASGRMRRGYTPRPFWSPDGKKFIYRYDNNIYISDEKGNKRIINNKLMDKSKETRWSWCYYKECDWALGPSKNKNIIMVKISDPLVVKTVYNKGNVYKHCEMTGNGKYLVYDDYKDIFVTPAWSHSTGIKISEGQSCRPCAAPDNRVAWLHTSHKEYPIYNASNGKLIGSLKAPEGEEIYRLNWSNDPDFAVHMYGSEDKHKIHVRKVSTGGNIFVADGWDPDLWVEPQ